MAVFVGGVVGGGGRGRPDSSRAREQTDRSHRWWKGTTADIEILDWSFQRLGWCKMASECVNSLCPVPEEDLWRSYTVRF